MDDFVRNFLVRMGLTSTLEKFETEWYELEATGKLNKEDLGVVPDVYLYNQELNDTVANLRHDLEVGMPTHRTVGTPFPCVPFTQRLLSALDSAALYLSLVSHSLDEVGKSECTYLVRARSQRSASERVVNGNGKSPY